jgi:putative phosphoribosyl transferase
LFLNRSEAGRHLAEALIRYRTTGTIVIAILRGGVPVAIEVADKLGIGLEITVPRKIAIPYNPEAGYGAVTEDGTTVLNQPLVEQLHLTDDEIQKQVEAVKHEIQRRLTIFRAKLPVSKLEDKVAIIVDDGLASGFTMLAAIRSTRQRKADKIVVAVPVASRKAHDIVNSEADEMECLYVANTYPFAVADYYLNWYDLTDEDVLHYIDEWKHRNKHSPL